MQFTGALLEIAAERGLGGINPHCRPYTTLCNLCWTQFDFLADIETFGDDMEILRKRLSLPQVGLS